MIEGYVALDKQLIYENGCFKRIRYWISGHHNLDSTFTRCRYITGYTGKETEVTVEIISPVRTFEVHHARGATA